MTIIDDLNRARERRQASDREVAKLVGMTVEKLDEDTTQPDQKMFGLLPDQVEKPWVFDGVRPMPGTPWHVDVYHCPECDAVTTVPDILAHNDGCPQLEGLDVFPFDHKRVQHVPCTACGCTGEGYHYDHWTGSACEICDGWGGLLMIDGKGPYAHAGANGACYRDDRGRYARIPRRNL